ncbi:hypothetical protein D3C86_601380 [compost metagenome]
MAHEQADGVSSRRAGLEDEGREPQSVCAGHRQDRQPLDHPSLEIERIGVAAVVTLGLLPLQGVAPAALQQGDLLFALADLGDPAEIHLEEVVVERRPPRRLAVPPPIGPRSTATTILV